MLLSAIVSGSNVSVCSCKIRKLMNSLLTLFLDIHLSNLNHDLSICTEGLSMNFSEWIITVSPSLERTLHIAKYMYIMLKFVFFHRPHLKTCFFFVVVVFSSFQFILSARLTEVYRKW